MPLGIVHVLVLREVHLFDVLFRYSLINKTDVISAYEIWISVNMNDANYKVKILFRTYLFYFEGK